MINIIPLGKLALSSCFTGCKGVLDYVHLRSCLPNFFCLLYTAYARRLDQLGLKEKEE